MVYSNMQRYIFFLRNRFFLNIFNNLAYKKTHKNSLERFKILKIIKGSTLFELFSKNMFSFEKNSVYLHPYFPGSV
mgnify:FL=1